MTAAVFEAALAGVLAAGAAADLAAVASSRRTPAGRPHLAVLIALRLAPRVASPAYLRSQTILAGLARRADDIYALKAVAALVAALLASPATIAIGVRPGVALLLVVAAFGFLIPDLVLRRRIARRRERLAVELPAVLDLLAVGLGAGLPIASALEQVARRHGGTLGAELRAAQASVAAGASRGRALSALRDRCPHEGVAAMVAAIERADRHGVRLAPALRAIATDARRHRARAVHERASRAAPQIQLVIALGLVPATMLIVAAVLVSSL